MGQTTHQLASILPGQTRNVTLQVGFELLPSRQHWRCSRCSNALMLLIVWCNAAGRTVPGCVQHRTAPHIDQQGEPLTHTVHRPPAVKARRTDRPIAAVIATLLWVASIDCAFACCRKALLPLKSPRNKRNISSLFAKHEGTQSNLSCSHHASQYASAVVEPATPWATCRVLSGLSTLITTKIPPVPRGVNTEAFRI